MSDVFTERWDDKREYFCNIIKGIVYSKFSTDCDVARGSGDIY